MGKYKQAAASQAGLGGLGAGNVVSLDGGKRLRMDDRVDFWPGTQAWQTVVDGPDGPASGISMTSLLACLKRIREAEGRPVGPPPPRAADRKVICNYCGKRSRKRIASKRPRVQVPWHRGR